MHIKWVLPKLKIKQIRLLSLLQSMSKLLEGRNAHQDAFQAKEVA